MFAVIRSGGKQYKVAQNEVIVVERMAGNSGASVDLGDVLIVGDGTKTTVGKPTVDGAQVLATVVEHSRGDKIKVFKRKRRKGYRRTAGHRQLTTVLRISEISAPGMKAAKAATKPAAKAKAATKPEAEAKAADDNKAAAKPTAKKADAKAAAKPQAAAKPAKAAEAKAADSKKAAAKPAKAAEAKAADSKKAAAKPAAKKPEAKKDKD